ncbi:MarR family transcriptional regulator [Nocardia abscessus]|uniref:MarR family transcriptional regulator n=1 Tax=Nocardia abscessus TaxID=120957 RepID=A0ABS0C590_9NOCA|nr:MarR family transcriptional regulator [Nocardia abscessus]MBF6225549.1 MarR family transcriptional regulator [Nocardia abscessus]
MAIQRGIGYWLVELDRLINQRFDEDLAAGGFSRRRWQAVHSLAEGPQRADDVRDALDTFWTDDSEWPTELSELVATGLVADEEGVLSLTATGRAAHDEAFVRIARRRRQMAEGITGEQFAETVRSLRRMAANLAGASSAEVGVGRPVQ